MIKMLIKFWPVLIPVALFILWRIFTHKKRKAGEELPHWDEKLLLWSLVTSLLIAIISLSIYVYSADTNINSQYIPPHYKDGKIIPGRMIPSEKD